MRWLIVEDGKIVNIIAANESFAAEIGALPDYDGAKIGDDYSLPPTLDERVTNIENAIERGFSL